MKDTYFSFHISYSTTLTSVDISTDIWHLTETIRENLRETSTAYASYASYALRAQFKCAALRSLAQHCAAYVHLKCQQIVSCLQVFYLKGETWAALGWTSPFLITNIDLQAKSQCFASPPVESLEVRKTLSHSVPSVRLHLCFMMCS
jgi:hypothetical protein